MVLAFRKLEASRQRKHGQAAHPRQWMKKILKCVSTEVFLNGADMVVEEDRCDLVGVI